MKKRFSLLFLTGLLIISVFLLAGCSETQRTDGKIHIVCTIFPQYDWVKQIIAGREDVFDVYLLADGGVDIHNFQPSADDIVRINRCDMFIYVGGMSDDWVESIWKKTSGTGRPDFAFSLLGILGEQVKEEERIEGMTPEEEHEGAHEEEKDEHVWLSLRHAMTLVGYMADQLCRLDPEGAEIYTANADAYIRELSRLDEAYRTAVAAASAQTLVFADRFPFRYLTDDYGLSYYAAFPGCSTETDASFETVIFLANKLDELGLDTILTIDGSNQQIAETVKNATKAKNQKILALNSLQSVSDARGTHYLEVMRRNLDILAQVLEG